MNQSGLQQQYKNIENQNHYAPGIRIAAKIISVVFHPLLLLLYSYLILAWSNPFLFGKSTLDDVFRSKVNSLLFIWLLIFSFLVPMMSVLMMKGLGLIKDIQMSEKTDRIGPYIIVGLLYMVIFVNFKNDNAAIPYEMTVFTLGATIAIFTAFIINLFSKISMHTVGMGGFVGMVMISMGRSVAGNEYMLALAVLVAGLVGTSRLILGAHEPADIYGGYVIGFLAQFVALSYLFG